MKLNGFAWCLGLLFAASTCFAQMYTVTDLGTLGGSSSYAFGINASGQVVGQSLTGKANQYHCFRTAANKPIDPASDDLGTLGGYICNAFAMNASGQAVGTSTINGNLVDGTFHAFRTAANKPIDPANDDLGTLGGTDSYAYGINASGQVVGLASTTADAASHAFRTAANKPIDPANDDLGTLGGTFSLAAGINDSGQVVGVATTTGGIASHAFRTAANKPIDPANDDLGPIGGYSFANAINAYGQVVGAAGTTARYHAFRTAANKPIDLAHDDLGTLVPGDGADSEAMAIDSYGQVVGYSGRRAFLYSTGLMHDLNNLIPADSGYSLSLARGINDAGQIAVVGERENDQHALLLTPIYNAFVQRPINADGSSVFKTKRGVIPVKFSLTQYDAPTCSLLPATIAITRTAGGTLGAIDENTYLTNADSGSNFRIDPTACQYIYNLAASSLGVGTYRVDISIEGIVVGHAVFALQ